MRAKVERLFHVERELKKMTGEKYRVLLPDEREAK